MVDVGDPRGNEVADWLVQNAAELGVQLVIWDGTIWSVARTPTGSHRPYTGPSPHRDHLHVELNESGSAGGRIGSSDAPKSSSLPMMLAGAALVILGGAALWVSENGDIR